MVAQRNGDLIAYDVLLPAISFGIVFTIQSYRRKSPKLQICILLDFSLTVKAATLIFISGCGSAISFAKEGKSGFIYNLVKS